MGSTYTKWCHYILINFNIKSHIINVNREKTSCICTCNRVHCILRYKIFMFFCGNYWRTRFVCTPIPSWHHGVTPDKNWRKFITISEICILNYWRKRVLFVGILSTCIPDEQKACGFCRFVPWPNSWYMFTEIWQIKKIYLRQTLGSGLQCR